MPADAASERVAWLRESASIVRPADVPADVCRDINDLPVLGTLVAAAADRLVTGDDDLLTLGAFDGRPIISPREFWRSLR